MVTEQDAIRWKGRTINREFLGHYLHSTVRHLKEFRIRPGASVGIAAAASPAYMIVLLSLWRLGVVPVLLHQRLAAPWLDRAVSRGEDPLLLVGEKQGLGRREVFLEDMVIVEVVEEFLGASQPVVNTMGPDAAAVVVMDQNSSETVVTFAQLGKLCADKKLPDPDHRHADFHDPQKLAVFYQSFCAGKTICF